jgi:LuxR family transcriptional regulator, maltose regulon positive regulatory protein
MSPIVDPGLVLKITAPKLRKSLLARERLRRLRAAGDDVPVFFVEAPAGHGKTSLLAQWRLDWLQTGAAVVWYSADADDTPISFVSGIVLGMRRSTGPRRFRNRCPRSREAGRGNGTGDDLAAGRNH